MTTQTLLIAILVSAFGSCAPAKYFLDLSTIDGGGGTTTGGLYCIAGTTGTVGYMTDDQYSALELQYIGNGDWVPLGYVGNLMPYRVPARLPTQFYRLHKP